MTQLLQKVLNSLYDYGKRLKIKSSFMLLGRIVLLVCYLYY